MDRAKQAEELMLRQEIKLLSFVDPLYPPGVNNFPNQPAVLYYKGNLRPPQTSVGIVGSRRCTAYGKQVAAEAAAFLVEQGITVVSGLAKGIDSYAHTACLKEGGHTLAFIANGPDICYPPEHRSLMAEIIGNGAVSQGIIWYSFSKYLKGRRLCARLLDGLLELVSIFLSRF